MNKNAQLKANRLASNSRESRFRLFYSSSRSAVRGIGARQAACINVTREPGFFRNVAMEPRVTRTTHDCICPKCWIGERQLEDTVTTNDAGENVKYVFLRYERNPDMPQEGRDGKEGASALESVTVHQAGERSRERGCRLSPYFVACCARRRGPRRKYRLVLQFESMRRR